VVCAKLVDARWGVLGSLSEVQAIGHRVVHGGERFTDPVIIDEDVKNNIRLCADLAPLHNPPNLGGIEACERAFPGVPNVAVFDTAFHQTMPASSYMFALPRSMYEKYGIRKYGFHGTSHKFVFQSAADYLSIPRNKAKLITCHLGNGASIAAVNGGRVLDTSMGMTPLMGLVMGTRCGDLDPGVVLYLLKQGLTGDRIDKILNKESGLLGVSDSLSSDMRDIIAAREAGDEKACQAFDLFIHRLVHYIGAYHTLLGGADAVVMTGGIGENSSVVREAVLSRLEVLGCHLDREANQVMGEQAIVSTPDSTLLAVVTPTNEELMIALETVTVLR
jgi:acetate kinase